MYQVLSGLGAVLVRRLRGAGSASGAALLLCLVFFLPADLLYAASVPSGSILELRLLTPIRSRSSRANDEISALVIAPVGEKGQILIPAGSYAYGRLLEVRRIGIGLVHERARLAFTFDRVVLPYGAQIEVRTQLVDVDNARETVDAQGRIVGIRATGSMAYRSAGMLSNLAGVDPIATFFIKASSMSALRFPESEIDIPAGAELLVRILEPVEVKDTFPAPVPQLVQSAAQREQLSDFVKELPVRTMVAGNGKGSDLVNLMFIADAQTLERAFRAAGWVPADALSTWTGFQTVRALAEQNTYREAPMSKLLLSEREPDYAWSKAWNNFAERHHLRIWRQDAEWGGQHVWLSSSTHDVAIAMSKRNRNFVHVIDEKIDDERAKVVNDLTLTGCVDAMQLLPRPWAPEDITNGTGQKLVTDKAIAIVKLNDCGPQAIEHPFPQWTPAPPRPLLARGITQFLLTTRNDLIRDNLAVSAVTGVRMIRKKNQAKASAGMQRFTVGDQTYVEQPDNTESSMIPIQWTRAREEQFEQEIKRAFTPPHLEISVSAGVPRFLGQPFSSQPITASDTTDSFTFAVGNSLEGRWTIFPRITFNHGNRLGHEFGYEYTRAALTFISPEFGNSSSPADIRRFSYNLLYHFRGRYSRVRPYVAIGPALQLTKLTDSVIHQRTYYKFGLKNLGMFTAAWDLGSKPPLEGGGIFQPALQYGGGIKWYFSSRFSLRADYRESLSRAPDFWTKSYSSLTSENTPDASLTPGRLTLSGPMRQQSFTLGIAIGF